MGFSAQQKPTYHRLTHYFQLSGAERHQAKGMAFSTFN
jgi:hypothetical protein